MYTSANATQVAAGLAANYALATIIAIGLLIVILMVVAIVMVAKNKMSVQDWQKTALGIPKGSVRAAIALLFGFITIGVWLATKDMPPWLIGILGTVVGFYFGAKATK